MDETVKIRVYAETRARLRELGRYGESYDQIILAILALAEYGEKTLLKSGNLSPSQVRFRELIE